MNHPRKGQPAVTNYRLLEAPGHLMRRCQQRAVEIYVSEVGRNGPTPRQFAALITVRQHPGLSQTDLVNLTGIDRSTIGDLISRLIRRGWLRRRRTSRDARAYALYVTTEGEQILERAVPAINAAQERILAPLAPARRSEFMSCLRTMADAKRDAVPGRDPE
ncbi:MAG: winged helix-turn-helix transcriptional regulator [Alphaproteobacteria bacterium]|nr:winged helix-turn-helix transcriptional regulator [Alphaproteobacteria bacterium]